VRSIIPSSLDREFGFRWTEANGIIRNFGRGGEIEVTPPLAENYVSIRREGS